MRCHTPGRSAEPHLCCPRDEPVAGLGVAVVIPALLPAVPRVDGLRGREKLTAFVLIPLQDLVNPPPIPPPRLLALA